MQLHKTDPALLQICHAAAQGVADRAERIFMATAAPTPSAAQLFFADSKVLRRAYVSVAAPPAQTPGTITEALQRAIESSFAEVLDEYADAEHHEDEATDDFELRADHGAELLADEHGDSAEHEGHHANRHQ